jgi:hypothetical protein
MRYNFLKDHFYALFLSHDPLRYSDIIVLSKILLGTGLEHNLNINLYVLELGGDGGVERLPSLAISKTKTLRFLTFPPQSWDIKGQSRA